MSPIYNEGANSGYQSLIFSLMQITIVSIVIFKELETIYMNSKIFRYRNQRINELFSPQNYSGISPIYKFLFPPQNALDQKKKKKDNRMRNIDFFYKLINSRIFIVETLIESVT